MVVNYLFGHTERIEILAATGQVRAPVTAGYNKLLHENGHIIIQDRTA